ncbi:hypothetical protein BN1723_013953, partial [Verticillium longisporum]
GTILTPNDESERGRLEIQHSLFQLCLDGALTSARLPVPTGRPLSILDIGAGTGAWAIAMAAQHPTASIRGVDVSAALLPTAVPPNVVFEVSDANEPWAAQPLNLDFVHVRNLVGGGVRDFKALYAQAFQHLRPGGQIEVAEVRSRWFDFEDDGPGASQEAESELTMEGAVMPASREFEMGVVEYSERLGIDFDPIPKVSGWLEDVGFEKVMEKSDLVPIRASGVDERMKRKGAQLAQLIDYGLECYALALFGRCGRSESDTRDLMQRIRRDLGRHFLAGILEGLPDVMPLLAPTINSYKRLVENFWAPVTVSWGLEHRAASIRLIAPPTAKPGATRFEIRVSGADTNPHFVLAAVLALGWRGVEKKLEIPVPPLGKGEEVGSGSDQGVRLAKSLKEANDRFTRKESIAREVFGDDFVDHFGGTREHEIRLWEEAVTDWEMKRYIETV